MKVLYLTILAGFAALYWLHTKREETNAKVAKGQRSEGDFGQEAPPSFGDARTDKLAKELLPDYADYF